jgi:hypothetical protein
VLWAPACSGSPASVALGGSDPAQPVQGMQEDKPLNNGAGESTPANGGTASLQVTTAPGELPLQDDAPLVCTQPQVPNVWNTDCILPPVQHASGGASALIPVTGGPLKLDCRANTLELPGGNRVVIRGLCGDYWAAVVQETKESLPMAASLYTFVDGITLQVLQGKDAASLTPMADMPPGALISYDFLVLPQMAEHHLVGLRLSGDAWLDVASARAGVFMEIPANQPGTFVMAAP